MLQISSAVARALDHRAHLGRYFDYAAEDALLSMASTI
jgi:hypothetical protein